MVDTAGFSRSGDISSLSANQQKALAALLTNTTIEAAADQCGLAARTIRSYLADENFSRVYREQRVLILQSVVAGLESLATQALETFKDAMTEDEDLNLRLRAAARVVDMIFRGVELERRIRAEEELEQRISELEEALAHVVMRDEGNGYRTYGRF
jgi:hypothetical protein